MKGRHAAGKPRSDRCWGDPRRRTHRGRAKEGFAGILGMSARIVVLGLLALSPMAGDACAADVDPAAITLLVFERPPYYTRDPDGGFSGVVAERAKEALTRAGIPFSWREMEPNGHMRTVEADRGPVCAVGWFRTPDRQEFALFSRPLYQDQAQVVLTRIDGNAANAGTLRELMRMPDLRLGAKLGYSYGPYVDDLIVEMDPLRTTVSQDDAGLARMLIRGRFDYTIVAFEEAGAIIDSFGEAGKDLMALSLRDVPPGNTRHLACSRSVGEDTIKRIDAALAVMAQEGE